jgi:hypothetical protein
LKKNLDINFVPPTFEYQKIKNLKPTKHETMNITEINNMEEIPTGAMQLYNPRYRDMDINNIMEQSCIIDEYVPYGYNLFLFYRGTSTIYVSKK